MISVIEIIGKCFVHRRVPYSKKKKIFNFLSMNNFIKRRKQSQYTSCVQKKAIEKQRERRYRKKIQKTAK